MDFHPDDLAAFNRITGHSRIPDAVKEAYADWKLAYDRNKGQGPLGMFMVPLLMSLGIKPVPTTASPGGKVDWTTVPVGTRVVAMTETGPKFGEFMGMRDYSLLSIKVDGDPMRRMYPPVIVSIMGEANVPLPAPPATPEAVDEHEDDLPAYKSEMDAPELKEPPKMASKEWFGLPTGTPLLIQTEDDLQAAKLVKVGPGDGELTVWVDGADDPLTVLETAVVGA